MVVEDFSLSFLLRWFNLNSTSCTQVYRQLCSNFLSRKISRRNHITSSGSKSLQSSSIAHDSVQMEINHYFTYQTVKHKTFLKLFFYVCATTHMESLYTGVYVLYHCFKIGLQMSSQVDQMIRKRTNSTVTNLYRQSHRFI